MLNSRSLSDLSRINSSSPTQRLSKAAWNASVVTFLGCHLDVSGSGGGFSMHCLPNALLWVELSLSLAFLLLVANFAPHVLHSLILRKLLRKSRLGVTCSLG